MSYLSVGVQFLSVKQRQVYQGSESQSESENSSRFMQIPVKSNIVDLHEMIPPRKPPSPKMTMIKRKGEIYCSLSSDMGKRVQSLSIIYYQNH